MLGMQEPNDLVIRENQRIRIVSRDSEDWYVLASIMLSALLTGTHCRWTGELNGKTGLFPASYVRAL